MNAFARKFREAVELRIQQERASRPITLAAPPPAPKHARNHQRGSRVTPERRAEMARRVAAGETKAAVAASMGVSPDTVGAYTKGIGRSWKLSTDLRRRIIAAARQDPRATLFVIAQRCECDVRTVNRVLAEAKP